MNQVIKGYVKQFCDSDKNFFEQMEENEKFEHFINDIIIKKDFSDDFKFEELHVGGANDCGIDGVAIVSKSRILNNLDDAKQYFKDNQQIEIDFVFIQSKTSAHIDEGEILKFFNGVEKFFRSDVDFKNAIQDIKEVQKYIYEQSTKFSGNPKLHLKYVYNGRKDNMQEINKTIERYKEKFNKLDLFSNISILILDSSDIQNIHKEISLNIEKNIKLEKITTLPEIQDIQESYIGIISLKEFLKLICDDDKENIMKNLFYDNVRDYQGDTRVNQEMIKTLKNSDERKYFGLYHNGITIVSKFLNKTGDNIILRNFQIVNGCQTSHIIAENKNCISDKEKENIFIPIKLIATSDNDIINSIIVSTNSHNEVKREAFESLEEFHKGLEDFYKSQNNEHSLKIYYERRNKQYMNADIDKKYIITLAEQIRTYLSMFVSEPHSTHRYYGELLNVYKEKSGMFKTEDKKEYFELYHIAGLTFVRLNLFAQEKKIKFFYKSLKYHILFLVKLLISDKQHKKLKLNPYKKECERFYEILKDDNKTIHIFNKAINVLNEVVKINNLKDNYRMKSFRDLCIEKAKLAHRNIND